MYQETISKITSKIRYKWFSIKTRFMNTFKSIPLEAKMRLTLIIVGFIFLTLSGLGLFAAVANYQSLNVLFFLTSCWSFGTLFTSWYCFHAAFYGE